MYKKGGGGGGTEAQPHAFVPMPKCWRPLCRGPTREATSRAASVGGPGTLCHSVAPAPSRSRGSVGSSCPPHARLRRARPRVIMSDGGGCLARASSMGPRSRRYSASDELQRAPCPKGIPQREGGRAAPWRPRQRTRRRAPGGQAHSCRGKSPSEGVSASPGMIGTGSSSMAVLCSSKPSSLRYWQWGVRAGVGRMHGGERGAHGWNQ